MPEPVTGLSGKDEIQFVTSLSLLDRVNKQMCNSFSSWGKHYCGG